MREMGMDSQMAANGGHGYKCSICGQKFYTKKYKSKLFGRTIRWKNSAYQQCQLHQTTAHLGKGYPKWCW